MQIAEIIIRAALAPDHQPVQVRLCQALNRLIRHQIAVFQHHDPVAAAQNLAQTMRDEDHPCPAAQPVQQMQEILFMALVKRGGRLIEEDHRIGNIQPVRQRHSPRDIEALTQAGGQIAHPFRHRDRGQIARGQHLARGLFHGAPVEKAHRIAKQAFPAEPEVLRHRQSADQRRILEDTEDAALIGLAIAARHDGFPIPADLSGVFGHHAGEDIEKRAFPRTILAEKADDLTAPEGK